MRTPPKPAPLALGLALVFLLAWQVWAAVDDGLLQGVVAGGGSVSGGNYAMVGSIAESVTGAAVGGDFELQSGLWLGDLGPAPTAVDDPTPAPGVHRLLGAWPNPFNPRTEIRFELASATRVTVDVHDVRGRLVRTLIDETRPSGPHRVVWDGTDRSGRRVASGTYFLRFSADDRVQTRKVSLLK